MEYLCKIKVARIILQEIAKILERDETDPIGGDALYSVTADFPNGYAADIKVWSGEPAYVDPLLFDNRGHQAAVMEHSGARLEGTYIWDLGENKYVVVISEDNAQLELAGV